MVIGGPDGFCVVVPASSTSTSGEGVQLKGHLGDVLDCKWFPSGQVGLSSSVPTSV
jgi:proteasomal ATPase-associated factor 1